MPAGTASTSAMARRPSPSRAARSVSGPIATGAAPGPCAISTKELFSRSNRVPFATRPSASSVSIHPGLAEMKISAGAPCWIWRASADDPASETTRSWPVAASKLVSIPVIALLMLAAANTVISPASDTAGIKTVTPSARIAAALTRTERNIRASPLMDISCGTYRNSPGPEQALSSFRTIPQHGLDCADPRGPCLGHDLLKLAVVRQNLAPGIGQPRASAPGPAPGRIDQRIAKGRVHLFYQHPRPLVAHGHRPSSGGDRACVTDTLQQVGLAGAQHRILAKDDADAQEGRVALRDRGRACHGAEYAKAAIGCARHIATGSRYRVLCSGYLSTAITDRRKPLLSALPPDTTRRRGGARPPP